MFIHASILVTLLSFIISLPATAADISVKVDNITTLEGRLYIVLVDEKGFAEEDVPIKIRDAAPTLDKEIVTLQAIKPGRYAVIVFQDLNQNEDLDMDFFGIPEEPTGLSNNPSDYEWKEASFILSDIDKTVYVSLE